MANSVASCAWVHYWVNDLQESWKVVPIEELRDLQRNRSPRYVTFLATTASDDPAARDSTLYDGPFVLDIDRKPEQGGKAAAIQDVQRVLRKFEALGVAPDQLSFWASGEKGFHVSADKHLFKNGPFNEVELQHLPAIYRAMAFSPELYCDGVDLSLYSHGRGKLLRQANVQRENGKYKVALTVEEVQTMTPALYDQLVSGPRTVASPKQPIFTPAMNALFERAKAEVVERASRKPKKDRLTAEELQDMPESLAAIEAVKREAFGQIRTLLPKLLPGGAWKGDRYIARNPMRDDRHPGSFMVYADGGFIDFACPEECKGGDLVALYAYLKGFGARMEDAARALAEELAMDVDAMIAEAVHVTVDCDAKSEVLPPAPRSTCKVHKISDLIARNFPPINWIVQDILPAGVTLFAAAPKTGKSWLALDVAVSVAAGVPVMGGRHTSQGDVLFLALEDNERRLQGRALKVMQARTVFPQNFDYATGWDRLGFGGGTKGIDDWLAAHPEARLVVVDTLAKVKPDIKANKDRYAQEYAVMGELKALADRYGVAILVITHTRKQVSADPLDSISGTLGLSGGVDNTWVMQKPRGEQQAALFVIGRDIEQETNYGLQWDAERCIWSIDGTAAEVLARAGQQEVLALLRKSGEPLSVDDVAVGVGKERSTVQRSLGALVDSGVVGRTRVGRAYRYSIG